MMKWEILASLEFVEDYIIHSYNCLQAMVPLNYNFILHLWYHTVFHVLIAVKSIFPRDIKWHCHEWYLHETWNLYANVVFTRDGNVTFSHKAVVLTKLSNWQDLSCL